MGYHHSGTLLQDRSCHRSPEILSKLDDQSGRSPAVVRGSLYGFVSGNGHNKDRARPMHETGGLAKQSHEICKYGASFITMKMYVKFTGNSLKIYIFIIARTNRIWFVSVDDLRVLFF